MHKDSIHFPYALYDFANSQAITTDTIVESLYNGSMTRVRHGFEMRDLIHLDLLRKALRKFMDQENIGRRMLPDLMSDKLGEIARKTHFYVSTPEIDSIFPDVIDVNFVRHFLEDSAYHPRYDDFLRWIDIILYRHIPEYRLAIDEYDRQQRLKIFH